MRRLVLLLATAATLVAAAPAVAHDDAPEGVLTHMDTRAELADVNIAATAAAADAPDALPYAWCGDERTTDDTDNAAQSPSSPRFKIVYVHAADRPDRFAAWRDALQANVALMQRFLASQSGGTKGLRIDMGTRCGPKYVDLQVVHLSGPRSHYIDNFSAIVGEVEATLGSALMPRNVVIVADQLNGRSYDYGLGENVLGAYGDRPGAGNVHNRGGFASVVFSRDGQDAPGPGARGWWPEGMLHEITHNLGGVQWSAPHSTEPAGLQDPRYGHCWQGADVMCYVEDGGAAHTMSNDCPRIGGAIPQVYDCGHDDYFNPAPAAGSYLATHWNVYDNAFLAPCAEIIPACGGGMAGLVPEPPVATAGPKVIGKPRRGKTVKADGGSWQNGPVAYAFRWQRLRGGHWRSIAGATRSTYRPKKVDRNRRLRISVVVSNPDGRASAASRPTARVTDPKAGHTKRCRPTGRARKPPARCRGRRT
jgi:hypothetical protein